MIYKISQADNKEQKLIHPWFFRTSKQQRKFICCYCLFNLLNVSVAFILRKSIDWFLYEGNTGI